MAIGVEQIGTNRYAAPESAAVNLYSTGSEGGSSLTLTQLVMATCLRTASIYESQSVAKMNQMTAGSVKLDAASDWLEKIAEGTADWAAAKAFAKSQLGMADGELPDGIDTFAKRMAAAAAFKTKMDSLTQSQQEAMIELQTLVNRRDVAYSTSSNAAKAIGQSLTNTAYNF